MGLCRTEQLLVPLQWLHGLLLFQKFNGLNDPLLSFLGPDGRPAIAPGAVEVRSEIIQDFLEVRDEGLGIRSD